MDASIEYGLRLGAAMVAGALIGFEREVRGKAAGMRTNMLICLGSCLLMIISLEITKAAGAGADPSRIASQVVTGIGFLGAGAIIRSQLHVSGLTTAATIWALAALGLVIGAGYYWLSALSTLLVFLTLTLGTYVERAVRRRGAVHTVELTLDRSNTGGVLAALKDLRIAPEAIDVERAGSVWKATLELNVSAAAQQQALDALGRVEGVTRVAGR
ncbi:MAG TPA: magnesium transporter MgtC [Planctomycetes bacterium]|nr:magnesium transporter MgtC [Planctomycetota bacterium]